MSRDEPSSGLVTVDLVEKAARAFPMLKIQQWDVAITDRDRYSWS